MGRYEGRADGFNRNENAEPIGALVRVFDAKSINVVRRIPNPLHRFFNPICRSFAGRIPTERALRANRSRQIDLLPRGRRIEKLQRVKEGGS